MAQVETNDLKSGMKVEVEGQPYSVVSCQLVKPGKGQAFARVKLKHLTTSRVVEKTFKSGDSLPVADVEERAMRLLYVDPSGATFMDDNSFEQMTIDSSKLEDVKDWLKDDLVYSLVFYKGEIATIAAPTFIDLEVTETTPGVRGDTASGRVMKEATVSTGAKIQIPIFIEEGEVIRVDTRTSEYVSRVNK